MTSTSCTMRVGLTGGIASGKSTVAAMFSQLGVYVVDADELAHAVTAPGGSAHAAVVDRFGPEILDDQGVIDRRTLARRIFGDRSARLDLNAIVHPRVREAAERKFAEHPTPIAMLNAALLVETGAYRDFPRLVVVHCSRGTQIRRLAARDGLPEDEALIRIEAQAPLEEKLRVADYTIDTEGELSETRERVAQLYAQLLRDRSELF